LKDQFYFAFFPLSKIIDLYNEVLSFTQKEGESIGAIWSRYKQLNMLGPELSIPDAMFMQHFMHGLSTESTKYLDMIPLSFAIKLHEYLFPNNVEWLMLGRSLKSVGAQSWWWHGEDRGVCHQQRGLVVFFGLCDVSLGLVLAMMVLGPVVIFAIVLAHVPL
jgi:hypothetical protein